MLSFVYPLFLLGAASLAVPLVLHMMNREIPVRVVFPSIRFIRRGHLPREGKKQLQDLFVLILRLLLLAAVVLTFARPVWRAPAADAGGSVAGDTELIIVLDTSASMSGWGGLSNARQHIDEILRLHPDAAVGMVLSGAEPVVVARPGDPRAAIREALATVDTSYVAGEHADALATALSVFTPRRRHVLVIVSDFQQSDWQLAAPPPVPPDTEVRFVDVNPERAENAGIVEAEVVPISDEAVRVVAEVRNFGLSAVTRKLTLEAAGESMFREVTLPAFQTGKVAFAVPKTDATRGTLSLTPDAYTLDDTYRFWIGGFPPVKVLTVTPLKQERRKAQELFFVNRAMSATDTSSAVRFVQENTDPDFLFAVDLPAFNAVWLLGAAGYLGEQEFAQLRAYIEQGGVLIATPGAAAGHMFHGLRQSGLLDARFLGMAGEHRKPQDTFALGWVNDGSLLGRAFEDAGQTDLFLFPIYRYVRLASLGDAQILLRSMDDDPMLLSRDLGKGRLFVSALAFQPDWSDLPMTGSFLPLVREMLAVAVPPGFGVVELECGQPVPPGQDWAGDDAHETDLDRERADTSAPTVFTIGTVPYEVNVSRRESLVDKTSLADLDLLLQTAASANVRPAAGAAPEADAETTTQLWPYCASVAALLFLAEFALIAWLDRREVRGRRRVA